MPWGPGCGPYITLQYGTVHVTPRWDFGLSEIEMTDMVSIILRFAIHLKLGSVWGFHLGYGVRRVGEKLAVRGYSAFLLAFLAAVGFGFHLDQRGEK